MIFSELIGTITSPFLDTIKNVSAYYALNIMPDIVLCVLFYPYKHSMRQISFLLPSYQKPRTYVNYPAQVTELLSDSRITETQLSLCSKSSINLINKSSL